MSNEQVLLKRSLEKICIMKNVRTNDVREKCRRTKVVSRMVCYANIVRTNILGQKWYNKSWQNKSCLNTCWLYNYGLKTALEQFFSNKN
jgi:hypothetical protein